jgi:hypothetical protein
MSGIAGETVALNQLMITTLVALKQNGTLDNDTLTNIFETSLKQLNSGQENLDEQTQGILDTANERLKEMQEAVEANF